MTDRFARSVLRNSANDFLSARKRTGVFTMDQNDWKLLEKRVTEWIFEAGQTIRRSLHEPLDIRIKSAHNDLVTNMDRSIERFLIGKIKRYYPDHKVISEEGYGDSIERPDGVVWFVDPIDGTLNFVRQKRWFAISIGIYEDGRDRAGFVYDVMNDEFFHCLSGEGAYRNEERLSLLKPVAVEDALIDLNPTWIRPNKRIDPAIMSEVIGRCSGTRAYGAASLELAYVACGLIDVYFSMRLSPWDYGAGLILIRETGGVATRADGQPINLLRRTSILAGERSVHAPILNLIRRQREQGRRMTEPPQP